MNKLLFPLLLFSLLPLQGAQALELNQPAPDFTLKTHEGKEVKLADLKDRIVVLEWFNRGCPFVQKYYKNGDMQALQKKYTDKGVVWLTINSTHKGASDYLDAEETAEVVKDWKIEHTTMLVDASGTVGKAYEAKTTPHMYVINKGILVYQGAIDDEADPSSNPKDANNYVEAALDELFAGKGISVAETKPYGCSVKYES